ncbi:hypothetical protein [Luteolibacter sp. Populi]|uniref:hypothetical protein n=1 Tax=Luteolibacter sp. Populi TaxID=3230487 RepID=UPI003466C3C1
MKRSLILLVSHLAVLGAGAWYVRADHRPAEELQHAAATKTGERSGSRPTLESSAKRLADEAVASVKKELDGAVVRAAAGKLTPAEAEKLARALAADEKGFGPPPREELAAAFLAWFRQDRMATLDFLFEKGMEPGKDAVLKQLLAELSPQEHLKLVIDRPSSIYTFRIAQLLGTKLGELEPAEAAALMAEAQQGERSREILRGIAQGWPEGKADRYIDMALASGGNATALLQSFLGNLQSPRRACELLVAIKGRNDLPEDFMRKLEEQKEMVGHLYRYADPSVPLDERVEQMRNLAWLRDATPEKLREGALKQISTVDINELMKSGPDYRYAFRHGAMSAEEILEAVRKTFPELAAASDYETRVRVYNELASEDAGAAFALISHLPPEERNLAVIHQARWSFRDNSPETYYSMISLAPGPDSSEAAPQREDAWNNYGAMAYREYGDAYVEWLRTLPPGINRDVARSTFAKSMATQGKKDLADEFSSR